MAPQSEIPNALPLPPAAAAASTATFALAPAAPPRKTQPAASSTTALAPGFRFHPTDEELVSYYLRRKVGSKPVRFNAIGEVDIYRNEPWELAGAFF